MSRLVIWDFDGTLARPSQWSRHLLDALLEHVPDHPATIEDLRPHLRGYPWHEPDRLHPELGTPDEWWRRVELVLANAICAMGLSRADASLIARNTHDRYVRPEGFTLFDDSMPVLAALRHAGWQQVILTNHVPEFRAIAEALGIASAVDAIVNSAETGAEKPHEAAFQFARSALGIAHDAAYVVGDSYAADITGAERAGLPGILVRTDDDRAHHRASDLYAAVRLLERLSDARY